MSTPLPPGRYATHDEHGRYAGSLLVLGCRVSALGPWGVPQPSARVVYLARWAGQRRQFEVELAELERMVRR